jgi:hypothetical protein
MVATMWDVTLQLAGRNLHVVRRAADCDACRNRAAHRPSEIRCVVDQLERAIRGSASTISQFRSLVMDFGLLQGAHGATDSEVLRHVRWLLETERLVVVECIDVRTELPELPRKQLPRPTGRGRPVPLEDEKTWVGIELLEDTGKPVANARYVVKGPSGTFEGVLDAKGQARITNIDPGAYDISFLDIHAREWKRT